MSPRRPVTALAAVLAATSALVALHRAAPAAEGAVSTAVVSRLAHAVDGDGVPRRERVVGDFARYQVEGRLAVTTDGSAPAGSTAPTLLVKGTWRETVARAGASGSAVVVAFTPGEVAPPTLLAADLARPFVVEMDAGGRVTSVVFSRNTSGDARQALRAVVAAMALGAAEDPRARAWQADEEDTTGQYLAEYRALSQGVVERRKARYSRVLSDRGLLPPADGEDYAVDSLTVYKLDERGAPAEIHVRESLRVVTGASTPVVNALDLVDARLTEQGHEAVPEAEVDLSERLPTLTAKPGAAASHDEQMARGLDFKGLQAHLADIERLGPKEKRTGATHAISQARAVLRLFPAAAADAARTVADPRTPPTTAGVLATGLATAGTDEARGALLNLARSADVDVRRDAVRALVQLRNGDDETMDVLESLLGDDDPSVATTAGLALGANVRQTGGAGASDANTSAVQQLIAAYDAAPDDSTRLPIVQALGNAGGREVLPSLTDALGRTTPLAQAAVFSLRFVPGDDVDQRLEGLLRSGPLGSQNRRGARRGGARSRRLGSTARRAAPRTTAAATPRRHRGGAGGVRGSSEAGARC